MTGASIKPRDWSSHPPYIYPDYKSSTLRGPKRPLVPLKHALSELTGPVFGHESVGALDSDLTRNAAMNGEPLGQRMFLSGRVLDEAGRPIPHTLIEIWQANAAGRYVDKADDNRAPLDPNFFGAGRAVTDADGRYRFETVKPGAYPWRNHYNAWRPNHIHFSLFGPTIASRLVTQMYFEGDPLLAFDPMYLSIPEHARDRAVAKFSMDLTQPDYALGYAFDIVLRGPDETPMEPHT